MSQCTSSNCKQHNFHGERFSAEVFSILLLAISLKSKFLTNHSCEKTVLLKCKLLATKKYFVFPAWPRGGGLHSCHSINLITFLFLNKSLKSYIYFFCDPEIFLFWRSFIFCGSFFHFFTFQNFVILFLCILKVYSYLLLFKPIMLFQDVWPIVSIWE